MFGMDRAAKPSASASATAASTIPSTLCEGFRPSRPVLALSPHARARPGGSRSSSLVGIGLISMSRPRGIDFVGASHFILVWTPHELFEDVNVSESHRSGSLTRASQVAGYGAAAPTGPADRSALRRHDQRRCR